MTKIRRDASPKGWAALVGIPPALLAVVAPARAQLSLDDTGVTTCYDDTGPQASEPPTHPFQDCRIARDAAIVAHAQPKLGGGTAGFDFTKVANDGASLPESAALGPGPGNWACTYDNTTGLLWEL